MAFLLCVGVCVGVALIYLVASTPPPPENRPRAMYTGEPIEVTERAIRLDPGASDDAIRDTVHAVLTMRHPSQDDLLRAHGIPAKTFIAAVRKALEEGPRQRLPEIVPVTKFRREAASSRAGQRAFVRAHTAGPLGTDGATYSDNNS